MRDFFWFDRGELAEIVGKIGTPKPRYETEWERWVLIVFVAGAFPAFAHAWWAGFVWLYGVKFAVQALNKKRFFDPLDWYEKKAPLRPEL
jgi:hypothetical protein